MKKNKTKSLFIKQKVYFCVEMKKTSE